MGMKTSAKRFYEVIQLIYPVVNDMLEEITTTSKDQMKPLPDHQIGLWKRGVTCSDGVWMTRGHLSKNAI